MPYIKKEKRFKFDKPISDLITTIDSVGELTYVFYKIAIGIAHKWPIKYSELAKITAALEHSKLELYRNLISPYEDEKRRENGDVVPNRRLQ